MNSCKNNDAKFFDFNSFNKKSIIDNSNTISNNNNNTKPTVKSNSSNNLPFVHDFINHKNSNLMDTLNNIYSEKKIEQDPLDKLFYQYNFSTGNNMRVNNNNTNINTINQQYFHAYNQQNNNNQKQECIYRVNSHSNY